jgi:hypothetical protein
MMELNNEENEAPPADPPLDSENEVNDAPAIAATLQDLRHTLAVIRLTAVTASITAEQPRDQLQAEAPRHREQREAEQAQLQRMTQVLEGILRDQRTITNYVGYGMQHPRPGSRRVVP